MLSIGVIAAILSMLVASASSILSKRVALGLGTKLSSFATVAIGTVPIALGMLLIGIGTIPLYDAALSIISGAFLSGGFILRYKSLTTQQVTNSVALSEVQNAIVVIFGLFVFNENIGLTGIFSIAVIFAGAILVMTVRGLKLNRSLIPALLANVSWAAYWILITFSVSGSGNFLLSLFLSRIAGVMTLAVLMPGLGRRFAGSSESFKARYGKSALLVIAFIVIITGLTNGLGDALFGVVAYYNIIAIGGAINALIPIIVALFAYFLYKERLGRIQLLGFLIMIAGAVALSLG